MGTTLPQMCPTVSQMYGGFTLETAWPNAWESMSTMADCLMMFLDYQPDAPTSTIHLAPKLPTGWNTISYRNISVVPGRAIDVTCSESPSIYSDTFTNRSGGTVNYDTYIRVPAGTTIAAVKQDGTPTSYTLDTTAWRVHVTGTINSATGSTTVVSAIVSVPGDLNTDGVVDAADLDAFSVCATGPNLGPVTGNCTKVDFDGDTDVDSADFAVFQRCLAPTPQQVNLNCAN